MSGRAVINIRKVVKDPRVVLTVVYRRVRRWVDGAMGDRSLGIRTNVYTSRYADARAERHSCEPVPYATLRSVRNHIRSHAPDVKVFVDIGCALGRPLYFFADDQFDRLTGYEVVPQIAFAAEEQMVAFRARRPSHREIRIVEADAVECLPLDESAVVFCYNPFGPGPLERLCERLKNARGTVYLYYANPVYSRVVASSLGRQPDVIDGFVAVHVYKFTA